MNVPGTRAWRLTTAGFRFIVCHRYGQSTDTVRPATVALASGMRGTVRVESVYGKPHRSRVNVMRRDPFTTIPTRLALNPGLWDEAAGWGGRGRPRLRRGPAPASALAACRADRIREVRPPGSDPGRLAPTDAVVCLIDLKHGVSAEPYGPRAWVVAETQGDAVDLLVDLLRLRRARALVCKHAGADSVYDLEPKVRPRRWWWPTRSPRSASKETPPTPRSSPIGDGEPAALWLGAARVSGST